MDIAVVFLRLRPFFLHPFDISFDFFYAYGGEMFLFKKFARFGGANCVGENGEGEFLTPKHCSEFETAKLKLTTARIGGENKVLKTTSSCFTILLDQGCRYGFTGEGMQKLGKVLGDIFKNFREMIKTFLRNF